MGERKVRSDKKVDVKPFVTKELKDCIYRLSYVTSTPVKDVIEELLEYGVRRPKVVDYLSQYFLRDIDFNNTIYRGDSNRVPISRRWLNGKGERINTRVTQSMIDTLEAVSYAMGCKSIARAAALIVDATIRDTDFIDEFAKGYIKENVDAERMKELKKVLKYINVGNPFDERISWAALLSHIMEDVHYHTDRVQKAVSNFMINQWDK